MKFKKQNTCIINSIESSNEESKYRRNFINKDAIHSLVGKAIKFRS